MWFILWLLLVARSRRDTPSELKTEKWNVELDHSTERDALNYECGFHFLTQIPPTLSEHFILSPRPPVPPSPQINPRIQGPE